MFILRAVRNTYSVGTRRIGYSLASDQIINMQRIITKWCVVRQNCVKCIMNWYALCLRTHFFSFSSPLLQHQDTEVLCAWEQTMDFIFAPLFWWWNAIDVVPLAARALQKVQQRPTQPAPALLKPTQCEDGRRRKVLDGKMAKDLNCQPCSSIP